MKILTVFIYIMICVFIVNLSKIPTSGFVQLLFVLLGVLFAGIHYYWLFLPTLILKKEHNQYTYYNKMRKLFGICLSLGVGIICLVALQPVMLSGVYYDSIIDLLVALILLFTLVASFVASTAIARLTKIKDGTNECVVCVFAMYFYLPIGVFFLMNRIGKLK